MKGYTLDTNIVTAYLKRNQLVRKRIRQAETAGHAVMLNAISYYEIKRGLLFSGARTQLAIFDQLCQAQGIVLFSQAALDSAAQIYTDLRTAGQLIEDADLLMGAIALANDLVLVTHNTNHLSRITGLQLQRRERSLTLSRPTLPFVCSSCKPSLNRRKDLVPCSAMGCR